LRLLHFLEFHLELSDVFFIEQVTIEHSIFIKHIVFVDLLTAAEDKGNQVDDVLFQRLEEEGLDQAQDRQVDALGGKDYFGEADPLVVDYVPVVVLDVLGENPCQQDDDDVQIRDVEEDNR
jgi:hypothetical protein